MRAQYRHLVFGGCGVRNAAYAGGLLALESSGELGSVEGFAGTSGGAIIAALAAVGYSPEEIRGHVLDLDFSRLLDGTFLGGLWRLFTSYGWHRADHLEQRLDELLGSRTGRKRTTFADLRQAGCRDLRITATSLSRRCVRVFPDELSDDLSVAHAVRMSISIPLLFRAQRYQDEIYVDGGVMLNVPIDLYDRPGVPAPTLGFVVRSSSEGEVRPIGGIRQYARELFAATLAAQNAVTLADPSDVERLVVCSDLGVPNADFAVTRAQKEALIEEGRSRTLAFLTARAAPPAAGGSACPR